MTSGYLRIAVFCPLNSILKIGVMMSDLQQISQEIQSLCQTPNTALKAIHLIIQHGGASERAWQAVYQRVMTDSDVDGAYYLASFAQKVEDLPFDGTPLIELVMTRGSDDIKQALWGKLPDLVAVQYQHRVS